MVSQGIDYMHLELLAKRYEQFCNAIGYYGSPVVAVRSGNDSKSHSFSTAI